DGPVAAARHERVEPRSGRQARPGNNTADATVTAHESSATAGMLGLSGPPATASSGSLPGGPQGVDFVSDVRNVIIIGSGPAGYTAAVYAARASLHPLVLEGSVTAGGALMNTTEVENFPGFRDGIMGPALMDEMRAQAERFGAELVSDDVVAVELSGDVKTVSTTTETYSARTVILATGSGYRELGLPNEKELSGRGVSWCATCDGFFFREQHIAVVGGGDSAIEEATFLTRFGSKVSLIHRRDKLRASKIMQERAFADPKLEIIWISEVASINGTERLESV